MGIEDIIITTTNMATPQLTNISSFTPQQKAAFSSANSLGTGVPTIDSSTPPPQSQNPALTDPTKSLSASNPVLGGASPNTPTGQTPGSDPGLDSYLKNNLDPYNNTIMGNYNQSKNLTTQSGMAANKSIADTGNFNINWGKEQGAAELGQMQNSQRGGIANPGALNYLQDSSTKRVRDLTQQMNDALANNQTEVASKLADLSVREQEAMTNARTSFLSQYFQGKQEQRSEASFQTPEQQAVMGLSTAHADAGVLPTDTLQQAVAKVQQAPSFQNNIQEGQANIKNALAQAAAAPINAQSGILSAHAAQTSAGAASLTAGSQSKYQNTLTDIMQNGGGNDATLVDGLRTGRITLQDLNTLINPAIDPQGVKRVTAAFLASNGSVVQNQAQADAIKTNANARASGSLPALGASIFNGAGDRLFGTSPYRNFQSLTPLSDGEGKTPSGIPYTIKK